MSTTLRPDNIHGRHPHFVDHDDELAAACRAMDAAAGNLVIVFAGIAGVGKTATARELAFRVKSEFPDGVLLAELDGTLDQPGAETEALRDFLADLGEPAASLPDRLPALRARFQARTADRRLLVLLDGVVRPGQVRALLPGDGRSVVLVTASGPMTGLAMDTDVVTIELSPLAEEAAAEFVGWIVTADCARDEPGAVSELVGLCGGLPRALGVAASMIRDSGAAPIAAMVDRLRDVRRRLAVLSPPGELSFTAAFTAAYQRLSDPAQQCYRALGLPPRLVTVNATALAAALDLPEPVVAEALHELRVHRLVDDLERDRFGVAGLVALHAGFVDEHLTGESPEQCAIRRREQTGRLVAHYHQRTYDADAVLAPHRPWRAAMLPRMWSHGAFDDRAAATAWLEEERATLTALVAYLANDPGTDDVERASSWPILLWSFHEAGKHVPDLLAVHEHGIAAAEALGDRARAALLHTQRGFAHSWWWEHDAAVADHEAGLAAARAAGDRALEASATEGLGLSLLERSGPAAAYDPLRRNLELAQAQPDPRRTALARMHLAKAERPEPALASLDDAEAVFREIGDAVNRAKCARWRGVHLVALERPAEAEPVLRSALETMTGLGRRFDQAEALVPLGGALLRLGRGGDARQCWGEALTVYQDLGATARAAHVRRLLDTPPGD